MKLRSLYIWMVIAGCMNAMQEMVRLVPFDAEGFSEPEVVVSLALARHCTTLRDYIEEYGIDDPIQLKPFCYQLVALFKKLLSNDAALQDEELTKVKRRVLKTNFKDSLSTLESLHGVIMIAHYLGHESLIARCMDLWRTRGYQSTRSCSLPYDMQGALAAKYDTNILMQRLIASWVGARQPCKMIAKYDIGDSVWACAWNHDASLLIGGCHNGSLQLCDPANRGIRTIMSAHNYPISFVHWIDNHRFLSTANDCLIKVWDITSGECMSTYTTSAGGPFVFSYLPQSHMIIYTTNSGKLGLISQLDTEQPKDSVWDAHAQEISAVSCESFEQFAASGSDDGKVKIWDIRQTNCTFEHDFNDAIRVTAWNRQKTKIAVGGVSGRIYVMDTETGNIPQQYAEHTAGIWSVPFADEQETVLFSGACDHLIKLWDLRAGVSSIKTIEQNSHVHMLSYNSDTYCLASASHDGSMAYWDMRYLVKPLRGIKRFFIQQKVRPDHLRLFNELCSATAEYPVDVTIPSNRALFDSLPLHLKALLSQQTHLTNNKICKRKGPKSLEKKEAQTRSKYQKALGE